MHPAKHFSISLLLALSACTGKPADQESATLRSQTATTSTTPPAKPAPATTTAPDDLVRALYAQHEQGKSPFFRTSDRANIDRFFAREIADLIWQDNRATDGERLIDADPLYDTQDAQITQLVVHRPRVQGKIAEVRVTFRNYEFPQAMRYQLVRQGDDWRIADIINKQDVGLLGELRSRPAETP